jgi:hypothetical protein
MSSEPKQEEYICDDDVLYTREKVADMFQSFIDKYPDRKHSGTYKGINYEIELINEKLPIGVERDYFSSVIYLTPELVEFYKSNDDHLRAIYKYRLENRIRAEGHLDIEKSIISNTYNQYYDMPYHVNSMSVVYAYTDFQSLKTECYVYNNIMKWIDVITAVYEKLTENTQE